ncbi:MAG: hypothetical protein MUC49_16060 [Raineya sp.]|jgi:hypothetical protein|nr:hypothetical protein [Raineya sp.]
MKKTIYLLSIAFLICFQGVAQNMVVPDPITANVLFLKYSIKEGYNHINTLYSQMYIYIKKDNQRLERPCYSFINFKMTDNFYHVMNDIILFSSDTTTYNYVDSILFKKIAFNETQFLESIKNKNAEERKSYLKRTPVYVLDYDSRDVQGRVKILKVEPYYRDEHFPLKEPELLPTPNPHASNVLFLKYDKNLNGEIYQVSILDFDSEKRKKNRGMGGLIVYYFISKKQLDNFGVPMPLGFSTELYPDMKYTYVVPDKYENVSLDAKQLLNLLKSKTLEERQKYLDGFKHIYLIDYNDKNFSDVRQKKIIEVRPKYDEDGMVLFLCGE